MSSGFSFLIEKTDVINVEQVSHLTIKCAHDCMTHDSSHAASYLSMVLSQSSNSFLSSVDQETYGNSDFRNAERSHYVVS